MNLRRYIKLHKVETASWKVNKDLATWLCGGLVIVATFLIVVDASMRTLFSKPIMGAAEVAEIIMTWMIFTAFAYALIIGAHVRVTLVLDRLPPRVRSGFEIFTYAIGLVFFIVLCYGAWPYFIKSWEMREIMMAPVVEPPMWVAKLSLPVGASLISAQFLILLIRSLHPSHVPRKEREEVRGV